MLNEIEEIQYMCSNEIFTQNKHSIAGLISVTCIRNPLASLLYFPCWYQEYLCSVEAMYFSNEKSIADEK